MQIRSSRGSSNRSRLGDSRLGGKMKVFLLGIMVGILGGPRILEFLDHYGFLLGF